MCLVRRFRENRLRRKQERQPAPEFLFEHRATELAHAEPRCEADEGIRFVIVGANDLPVRQVIEQDFTLTREQAPTLTITSDPHNDITIIGGARRDWWVNFWSEGRGATESEAVARAQRARLDITGGSLSLRAADLDEPNQTRAGLLVQGPADASLVVHASYAVVRVVGFGGFVRIASTHARATVLESTGQVDVTAGVVDFAAAGGRVTISAETEINLKLIAPVFDGTLLAWAQGPVRLLVPQGLGTPLEAIVSRRENFVCRTDWATNAQLRNQGGLSIFTYVPQSRVAVSSRLKVRSEASTVVIDTTPAL